MTDDRSNFFRNKIILAPMVRMNTLPFRLLCLDFGADVVFSEEIIDHKIIKSERVVNDVLQTIDYIDPTDGSLIFRTCAREKPKLILQIGTSCPERAAEAASLIEKDVAGIDVNMGCPKHFSVSGGMGAALLSNSSKACNIIKKMKRRVDVPVTCKIRVLENSSETLSFCKAMEDSGVCAITVHGRTPKERPRHQNRNSVIREVATNLLIPVIANGGSNDIHQFEDMHKFKDETRSASVMIGRAAQLNASVFRKTGKLPLDDVIKAYLRYAIEYDNFFSNTKYCIQSMLGDLQDSSRGKLFLETQNLRQICELWDLEDYCQQTFEKYRLRGLCPQCEILMENPRKKFKLDKDDVLSLQCSFNRAYFTKEADFPKSVLLRHARKEKKPQPKYDTQSVNKLFQSVVEYDNRKYCSSYLEKNKKSAEQGAALVCLCFLKIVNENECRSKGVLF